MRQDELAKREDIGVKTVKGIESDKELKLEVCNRQLELVRPPENQARGVYMAVDLTSCSSFHRQAFRHRRFVMLLEFQLAIDFVQCLAMSHC